MNLRVVISLLLTGLLAALVACNWISPQCTSDSSCPMGSYCNAKDQVCFDIIPDAGSDAGNDAGSPDSGSGGADI